MDRSRAALVLSIVGTAVVAAGASLPWVRPNPTSAGRGDAVPDILLPQMNAGLEPYGLLVLGPAVVAVACAVAARVADRRASLVVFLAGGTVALVPLGYLFSRSLVGFDGTFVPALGWYATVCGGLVLGLAGLVRFAAAPTVPTPD